MTEQASHRPLPEVTAAIAEFICSTDFASAPQAAIQNAKGNFLDCLGVALAAHTEPHAHIIVDLAKSLGETPLAAVWGTNFNTSPSMAALANGTLAHLLDFDDGAGMPIPLHPSAPLLPAVFALGEYKRSSGKEVLEAYVLGLEVEMKLASAISVAHYEHGWHATGTIGTLGATAGASRLMGLDTEGTQTAFGIAASMAGGLRQNFGTMTKPLHAGNAAKNGVMAALLAQHGFSGNQNILEAEYGFCNIFAGAGNYNLERLAASPLTPFEFTTRGMTLKKYPSCYSTHTLLDSALALATDNDIDPEEIESISCGVTGVSPEVLVFSRPETAIECKFSAQFCVATAFVHQRLGMDHFTGETLRDPRVQRLLQKVTLTRSTELEGGRVLASRLTLRMRDGREYYRQTDVPRGHFLIPLGWQEICEKFRACASTVLPAAQVEQIIETVAALEDLPDIHILARLLARTS